MERSMVGRGVDTQEDISTPHPIHATEVLLYNVITLNWGRTLKQIACLMLCKSLAKGQAPMTSYIIIITSQFHPRNSHFGSVAFSLFMSLLVRQFDVLLVVVVVVLLLLVRVPSCAVCPLAELWPVCKFCTYWNRALSLPSTIDNINNGRSGSEQGPTMTLRRHRDMKAMNCTPTLCGHEECRCRPCRRVPLIRGNHISSFDESSVTEHQNHGTISVHSSISPLFLLSHSVLVIWCVWLGNQCN